MSSLEQPQPFTALIPQAPREPIVIYDNQAALRLAVIEKDGLKHLDKQWEVPGVYCLLYPIDVDGSFSIYVGKAAANGLKDRVSQHVRGKENWVRALLIAGDTTFGFNSMHVGWLEGRLWSLCEAAEAANLVNNQKPGDPTLPPYERAGFELKIPSIRQILRLLGYSLEPADEIVTPISPTTPAVKARYDATVLDLINAGELLVGATLEFVWKGFEGTTAIVRSDGSLETNGKLYATPSGAGQAVRGGATNGWATWFVRDAKHDLISLAELRSRLPNKTIAPAPSSPSGAPTP